MTEQRHDDDSRDEHPNLPAAAAADAEPAEGDLDATTEDGPARPRRRWRRWVVGGVIAAAVLAGGATLTGLSADGEEAADAEDAGEAAKDEEKPPVPVELATVATGDVSAYITATTNLVAEGEVKVLAEVEGRIERVTVDEGDYVEKGQVLATLARRDAEISLEKARVREENAQAVHQRGIELSKDQLISAEDLDKRRLDYELAHQERAEAEWRLAKTEIRAPISGRLSLRSSQPGQHVRPGDEMFQITDFDPLVARIYLPEKDVLNLATGRPVEMSLDAAPDVRFSGRIRQISPVVDTATGTVKVTVEATRPPSQVRPGSFVTVQVVRERRAGAVVLPKGAVLRELKQAHVFVAAGEGDEMHAERREVTLGLEEGDRIQALGGIEPGERLVVAGQGSLAEGARIRTLDAEETKAAAASLEG
jgi:membrane fusion protein (multidrug efflux system)